MHIIPATIERGPENRIGDIKAPDSDGVESLGLKLAVNPTPETFAETLQARMTEEKLFTSLKKPRPVLLPKCNKRPEETKQKV